MGANLQSGEKKAQRYVLISVSLDGKHMSSTKEKWTTWHLSIYFLHDLSLICLIKTTICQDKTCEISKAADFSAYTIWYSCLLPTTKSRNLFEMMREFVLVAFKFLFKVPGKLKMAIFEFTGHTHSCGFVQFCKMMISEPLMYGFLATYALGKNQRKYIFWQVQQGAVSSILHILLYLCKI